MVLSEMIPDRRKHNSTDSFGNWDIDINHDWVGKSWTRFSEIEETESFIKRSINDSDATQVRNNQANVDCKTLNNKQKIIFERIERHYIALTSNESVEPL